MGTYLAAQYRHLAARQGRKRALAGVAHSLLHIIYHLLKEGRVYAELGGDCFDRLQGDRLVRHLVKRLESLGIESSSNLHKRRSRGLAFSRETVRNGPLLGSGWYVG
jgi:hypothetical protein